MLHLEDLLVHGRIRCRQPIEGAAEFERAVQIGWAMPSGLRKGEIRDYRRRAWRLDQPSRAGCGLICASIHFKGSIAGLPPLSANSGRVAEAKAMLDDEKALEESTMRADELASAGDDNGDAMWRRIAKAVVQLANNTPPGLVH